MPFVVTSNLRLQVEDDQAQNEEQAKVAAIEQLCDFFVHHTFAELLQARKVSHPLEVELGEDYSGEELVKLCEAEEDNRYYVVVGKRGAAIVSDKGNDNYRVEHICDYAEED